MPVTFIKKKPDKDERLAIRIAAKDKFAIELYAHKHGKSISAIAKEAIDAVLKGPNSCLVKQIKRQDNTYVPDLCWDALQPDRLVKLSLHAPELLNDHERVIWKVICEEQAYWSKDKEPNYGVIRESWVKINSQAAELLKDHG